MVVRKDRPEGEPFLRGMGSRCLYAFAGSGRGLTYEGAAGDFWVHFSLCSVPRLRLLSYMCANGPARPPALASALGLPYGSVLTALNGMKDTRLVESHVSPIVTPFSRSKTGGVYALDWHVTEDGRKYLWRYAWVTGKLNRFLWREDTWNGVADVPPWDALAQDAQPSLLRPAHLAIADWLRDFQPIEESRLAGILGLPISTVHHAFQRWRKLGWVDTVTPYRGLIAHGPVRRGGRQAVRWTFNRSAYAAMDRHVHALRWAGQTCGYTPPDDDPFLNETFGPGWIQMTIE